MFKVSVTKTLTDNQVNDIFEIIINASEIDGARPFSEHVELHLRSGGDRPVIHFLATTEQNKVVGYGHLDTTDLVAGPSGELVVAPEFRLKGIATQIISQMKSQIENRPLRLWSHGDTEIARQFTSKLGFEPVRNINQMRRSLFSPIDSYKLPDGYSLREFNPQTDIQNFLRVNKLSFSELPDQSSWTQEDVELRIKENWFSASGFILLENNENEIVGFCWTKVHGQDHQHASDDGHQHLDHGHNPIGEIYVLGVHPQEQGKGLGKTLTLWGLNHLRRNGLDSAMLYVDSNNHNAINLYKELGFGFWGLDRLYRSLT